MWQIRTLTVDALRKFQAMKSTVDDRLYVLSPPILEVMSAECFPGADSHPEPILLVSIESTDKRVRP